MSTLLSSELDVAATASGRHYALLQRIRDYIEANLDSPELGPTTIATAHYVSTRQLHSMFRSQGTTVSTWIREQRLERCRRDLLDPRLRDQPVAVIAARHGFLDAAHFSRVFKARFGAPPTEVRMMQAA